MHIPSDVPDLATLRELCGERFPDDPSENGPQEIRPGLWVYGHKRPQRYMLRATRWSLREDLRPLDEIQRFVAERHWIEDPLILKDRNQELMQQICTRAAAGDERALHVLLGSIRAGIETLDRIEEVQSAMLRRVAEESTNWPVLMTSNRQGSQRAHEHVTRLGVGTKAVIPLRPRQKINRYGIWAKLVEKAIELCRANQVFVPALEAQCRDAVTERKSLILWGTPIEATFYCVSPTECIVITDWEKDCVKLALPIERANSKAWWNAIKQCVLEYWTAFQTEYRKALTAIGHADDEEWRRRNLAIDRVEQAFQDLFGLRGK